MVKYPRCIFEKGPCIWQPEPGVWFFICWNAPSWLACSRRSDSRAWERGREPRPPHPVLPVYNLTCSQLTAVLYFLSAWNRLLPDTTSMKAFGQFYSHCVRFLVYEVPWGVLLRILVSGVLPGSPNPDTISDQKLSFFTPVFRPGL